MIFCIHVYCSYKSLGMSFSSEMAQRGPKLVVSTVITQFKPMFYFSEKVSKSIFNLLTVFLAPLALL